MTNGKGLFFCEVSRKEGEKARYIEFLGNFLPFISFSFDLPSWNLGKFLFNGLLFGNSKIFGFAGNFPCV